MSAELLYSLKESILAAAQQYRGLGPLEQEVIAHAAFASRRAKSFLGRNALMEAAHKLAAPTHGRIKVLHGISGSGKTSLMCASATRTPPHGATLIRMCGTTTRSSSARGVLTSLCQQLTAMFKSLLEVPQDFRALSQHFVKLLQQYASKVRDAGKNRWAKDKLVER